MKTGSGPELSPNHALLICFAGKYFGGRAPGNVCGDGGPPLQYVDSSFESALAWGGRWQKVDIGTMPQTPVQLPVIIEAAGQSARTHMPLSTYHQRGIAFHP
jgi:hypothetical protein